MKTVNVSILSGACCNPQFAALDEKIKARVNEISEQEQLQVNTSVISISVAAVGGIGLGKKIDEEVKSLIETKGMSVLPIVFFNGMIAFYGGLAKSELIKEKLCLTAQE